MQAIVLAAGEASRLPNKPLLPIAYGKVAIESALEFAVRCTGADPIVVDSPARVVSDVLAMRGWTITTVVQPEPLGVPDAISRGAAAIVDVDLLVLFCDNIYDTCKPNVQRGVSTLMLDNDALDGWDHKWIPRCRGRKQRIAGYYMLNRDEAMLGTPGESSVDFLNRIGAKPVPLRCESWHDIGTVISYKEYINAVHKSNQP